MTRTYRYDLLCLGGAAVDWILQVPRLPVPDEKLVAKFAGRVAGGLVANTACAAARLGLRVAWSGVLGNDEGGRILRQSFEDFGVEVVGADSTLDTVSDFTVILLEPSGRRTILIVSPGERYPSLTEAGLEILAQTRLAYTVPWTVPWLKEVARACQQMSVPLILDVEPNNVSALIREEIPSSLRLLFVTQGTLDILDHADDTVGDWLEAGVEQVVITRGNEGAVVVTRAGKFETLAFRVPVVDTTGAGDCFHAAYMAAWLWGWSPAQAVRFASAAAALSVQHLGARGGLPTFQDVMAFLAQKGEAL
ncbi:carbohydrate kinase family protein [Thermanaerothrix sp. 4228-RoL]|uniref:Carbohydrate kinase family protein n=2 Tax=Thermanaerothrix TaxID=1077886 RepID=A0ABU3NRC1_9CHLR|nr:carbohydrate kinase family protein [Thermanaerothrix sp. 4228-RoL]MDT8899371.1 carbohydrate kinase family protein [Thermanaerothrix sp. 4228-RoL]